MKEALAAINPNILFLGATSSLKENNEPANGIDITCTLLCYCTKLSK